MIRCQAQVDMECTGYAMHQHHRLRRSQGGDESPENLIGVCVQCHNWIHAHPSAAQEMGLLVQSWQEPADVPLSAAAPGHTPALPSGGSTEGRCPRCKGSGKVKKEEKLEKPRKRKTWSVRVPDDAEDGADVIDGLVQGFRESYADELGWSESVPKYYPLVAALAKANQEV